MVGVCVYRREREECGEGGACARVSACCGYGPARPGGRLLFPGSKLLAVHWKSSPKRGREAAGRMGLAALSIPQLRGLWCPCKSVI